ncbi:seed linoleate 9S-lipoxygenase-3-like [Prosopis cineraria]|uniref:seed linoleate 9S-lipoxygenase-3-like n=1 Tax=Prosopis cineraria TaxID=364024 RepID=UPI00240ECFFB|nr:seed linoleate 9S-lipoxygenase-3-like [Prosopis cineraria]
MFPILKPSNIPVIGNIFDKGKKIKGTVVLMRNNALNIDLNSTVSTVFDGFSEFLGQGVTLQLVSAVHADPANGSKGKVGKPATLESWLTTLPTLTSGQTAFTVHFDWEDDIGIPGAFIIRNNHATEFFLVSLTIEDFPNHGDIHFLCNSWVYPARKYNKDRIFFSNKTYLPSETPAPLVKYREEELVSLRGDGTGERKEWERIYDYATYNDLGDPSSEETRRPVLGGSSTYPYPRRGRTGRSPTEKDPNTESRLDKVMSFTIYVPRDEQFGHLKMSDFLTYGLKSVSQSIQPSLNFFDKEFDSFEEVRDLYDRGIKLPEGILNSISDKLSGQMLKEIFRTDGERLLKFPTPQVIRENKSGWMTDEEFAREMLAGVNPGLICRLEEFPPRSKLDSQVYGDQTSKITKQQLEINMGGLTVDKAIKNKKLFILDHHDPIIPYLRRINLTSTKAYASRTILVLKDDGTLKPLAIELSKPHPNGDQFGVVSEVFLPAEHGVESTIWLLAKAYVVVNDSCFHQLISHWLNTHAVIEPFIIATNRQLSVLHPVYKLLLPHYRDTMNINALARQVLINAGGIIEDTFLWGRYSLEMSSKIYKDWKFYEQALPADLLKRGMAESDPASPNGIRLVIEDYPYAVDGLEIYFAIRTWVQDYISFYYKTDDAVKRDSELQSWWKEAVEVGHGDKKDDPTWFKMQNREELIESCTIIIWVSSALHAAVNFGQYPYGGYILNRPTLSRRFMPEKGTPEYDELAKDPHKAFLKTITPKDKTITDLSTIEILSRHTSDEFYLGQRDSPNWTSDTTPLEAFKKFGKKLEQIEGKITSRNKDSKLRNRYGPVNMPYTLLYPTSEVGLTGKGIPNSISI